MFLYRYFYWSGVVMNVAFAFLVLLGIAFSVRNWKIENDLRKKYATKSLKENSEKQGIL